MPAIRAATKRAGDGIRTRDVQLGKLALYHLVTPVKPTTFDGDVEYKLAISEGKRDDAEQISPTHFPNSLGLWHHGTLTLTCNTVQSKLVPREAAWNWPGAKHMELSGYKISTNWN